MSAVKVLYVSFDDLGAGKGAAIHIKQFAEALARHYDVTIITPGARDSDGEWLGARRIELALTRGSFVDRVTHFRARLAEHLSAQRYDLIHFRSIWEGRVVAEQAAAGAQLIYEANGFPSIELKYHYPRVAANRALTERLRAQELALLLAARLIITPCQVTKGYIESLGINGEKVVVISNGADTDLFQPAPVHDNGDESRRLIYIGTLAPWQGIEVLLRAMKQAQARRPFRLAIVGRARKSWLKRDRRLVSRFKLEGQVDFIEACEQAEIAAHINGAEIAIAPLTASDRNIVQGCSPIKLFEYAACGRAIVAADLPAVREILTHGENALLYNPRKPAQLCHRIIELAEDSALRARLGAAARALVEARYTWRQAQERLIAAYRRLLK